MEAAPVDTAPDLQSLVRPLLVVDTGTRPSALPLLQCLEQTLQGPTASPSPDFLDRLVRLGSSLRIAIDNGGEQVSALEQTLAAVDHVVAPSLTPPQLERWNRVTDGAAAGTVWRPQALQLHRQYIDEIARAERLFVHHSDASSFGDVDWSGVIWYGTPEFSREILRAVRWSCGMKGSNRLLVEFEPSQVAERLEEVIERARNGRGAWNLTRLRSAVVALEREQPIRGSSVSTPEPSDNANAQPEPLGRGKRAHLPVDYSRQTAPQQSKKRSKTAPRPDTTADDAANKDTSEQGAASKAGAETSGQQQGDSGASLEAELSQEQGTSVEQAQCAAVPKAGAEEDDNGTLKTFVPTLPGDLARFLDLPARVIKATRFQPNALDCDEQDASYSLRWPEVLALPTWELSLPDVAEREKALERVDLDRTRARFRIPPALDETKALDGVDADKQIELLSHLRLVMTDILRQQTLVLGYLLADLHVAYRKTDILEEALVKLGQSVPKFGGDGRPIPTPDPETIAAGLEAARAIGTIPRQVLLDQLDAGH
ncbi:hypothetical protein JCM10908_006665 [Rhodotorula pacifica]|uniref:uncharacterized protein n=1 Tax=Rhodotorula pacifica TaxID=1495444 RepID=UPI003177A013